MKKIECPICGGVATLTGEKRSVQVGKRSAVVEDRFFRCGDCGEETYEPGQVDAVMRKASDEIRANLGLLTPQEIKTLRERLALSQADFEKLIGAGPKTVVRWERGTVFQNGATDSLLRALGSVDGVASFLARRTGIRVRPAAGLADELLVFDSNADNLVAEDRFVPEASKQRDYPVQVGFDWLGKVA